jgi:hypothetical protein
MKYKRYLYGGGLAILLFLHHIVTWASNPNVNMGFSHGAGIASNVILLKDVHVTLDVIVNGQVIYTRISLDVPFKGCVSAADTLFLIPILSTEEPLCQGERKDFRELDNISVGTEKKEKTQIEWDLTDSRAFGTFSYDKAGNLIRSKHEVQLTNVRLNTVTNNANGSKITTAYYNFLFDFNPKPLHLEQTAIALAKPPSSVSIVLDWDNKQLRDLDMHLTGPDPHAKASFDHEKERFHLHFDNRHEAVADLRIGRNEFEEIPEYITLLPPRNDKTLRPGQYRLTVHHFSGSGVIAKSNAQVNIQIGDEAVQRFVPPVDEGFLKGDIRDLWVVCEFEVTREGMVNIIPINRYSELPNGNPYEIR